jgi:hypothetical protein
MDTVVGENGMDLIGDCFDQRAKKIRGHARRGLLMQLDNGKFTRAINGDEQMELAVFRSDLGGVDVEIARRIGFEFALSGLSLSTSGRRLIPCGCRQRCRDDRERCGIVACSA